MSPDDGSTYRDWHGLAEQASKEANPEKLLSLIKELCDALDHRPAQSKPVNKESDAAD